MTYRPQEFQSTNNQNIYKETKEQATAKNRLNYEPENQVVEFKGKLLHALLAGVIVPQNKV